MNNRDRIILKKSSTAGKVPHWSMLEVGELAVNFPDAKLFTRDTANNIIELGGSGGSLLGAGDGVVITENEISVDDTVVRTTGNQVVSGDITFTGSLSVNLDTAVLTGKIPVENLPNSALIGDTTYDAGNGISLVGTTFSLSDERFTSALLSKLNSLENVNLTGGTNVTVSGSYPNLTISSTDTNTTYSAGTGITLTGTTFSLADERFTSALLTKLNGIESGAQVNVATNLGYTASTRVLTSSTGTNVTLPEVTTGAAGLMSASDKTKLNGIAAGATANATNAQLRDRATHTGTQAISTVTGLQTSLDSKLDVSEYTASDVLEKLKTVDGAGSGLDADLLDGLHSSNLVLRNSNTPIGTSTLNYVAGTTDSNNGGFRVGLGGMQAVRLNNSPNGSQWGVAMHMNAFYRSVEGVWGYTAPNQYIPLVSLEVRNGSVLLKTHPATGGAGNAHVPQGEMTTKSLWDSSDFSLSDVNSWNTAYGWGNHANAGYLTSVSWGDIENLPATFPPTIGATSTTAVAGNDSRLTNAREWTATVVSQAEAEAGTATTPRKWTAQRVRQAITAWWAAISIDAAKITTGFLSADRLPNSGVTGGSYGSNIQVPTLTLDAKGRVTGASNTTIRSASTSTTGVVQLNNSLTSTSTTQALTAAQGKVLKDAVDQLAGSADWVDITTTTNVTLADNQRVRVDSAGLTITLPASPAVNTKVSIAVGGFKDTIIARNGRTILGKSEDAKVNKEYATVTLYYDGATWRFS